MKINFEKYADGLVPAIVQDSQTQKVLMLGFMNRAS
ncbi:MAG: bifunctional phosphoribosyl-AMP cyclohydrolase/phosphoribosyl-ATP diphosphatase, partial [Pyrinomonadaceae bacterium]